MRKRNLKKQSQCVAGQNDVTLFVERTYGNKSCRMLEKGKSKQSQFAGLRLGR
jgi:hypothetical protein